MSANAPKVLLRSEESGGHVATVELGGGGRPPLHRHDCDETFYVLEGELTFRGSETDTRGGVTLGPPLDETRTMKSVVLSRPVELRRR